MKKELSTDMNQRRYITPMTKWVWIGMDEEYAQTGVPIGGNTSGATPPDTPPFGEEDVNEEKIWTEDTWTSASSGGVWDNAW